MNYSRVRNVCEKSLAVKKMRFCNPSRDLRVTTSQSCKISFPKTRRRHLRERLGGARRKNSEPDRSDSSTPSSNKKRHYERTTSTAGTVPADPSGRRRRRRPARERISKRHTPVEATRREQGDSEGSRQRLEVRVVLRGALGQRQVY